MILLTGHGAFAQEFLRQCDEGRIVSLRTTPKRQFIAQVKQARCIIHNAADKACTSPAACVTHNFYQTAYLLHLLHRVNPDVLFLYLSSMSMLASDTTYRDVGDMTPYAYSKYLGETYCRVYPLKRYMCIRFSTLFYKDYMKDGISKLIYDAITDGTITLLNDGEAKRDILPLEIAVAYVQKIINQYPFPDTVITIASARQTSFNEIAGYLKKKLPGLCVKHRKQAVAPVLSSFDSRSIDTVGRIEFSLEKEIDTYIDTL